MDKIISEVGQLIDDKDYFNKMAKASNPYGDGTTAKQIVDIILEKTGN